MMRFFFFFSSRRRHTRLQGDWSSDVCSSDLDRRVAVADQAGLQVPRQRADGTDLRRTWAAETMASRPSGVRRLRPRRAGVEREIDAGGTDSLREWAGTP